MKTFSSINNPKPKLKKTATKDKISKKDMMTAQKLIDLVLVRNFGNKKPLSYNLVPNSYLFDEEGCMIESGKSVLVREIEKIYISKEGHCFTNSNMFITFLVDVLMF